MPVRSHVPPCGTGRELLTAERNFLHVGPLNPILGGITLRAPINRSMTAYAGGSLGTVLSEAVEGGLDVSLAYGLRGGVELSVTKTAQVSLGYRHVEGTDFDYELSVGMVEAGLNLGF